MPHPAAHGILFLYGITADEAQPAIFDSLGGQLRQDPPAHIPLSRPHRHRHPLRSRRCGRRFMWDAVAQPAIAVTPHQPMMVVSHPNSPQDPTVPRYHLPSREVCHLSSSPTPSHRSPPPSFLISRFALTPSLTPSPPSCPNPMITLRSMMWMSSPPPLSKPSSVPPKNQRGT